MNIRHNALVLIADGQRYLFFRNEGDFRSPVLKLEGSRDQSRIPRTHEQGSDQPGRSFSSASSARSAMEQTDFHQQEKDQLAAEAAEQLRERALSGDFDELIVVAPPKTLAELRRNYDKSVSSRIVAEIGKDLTNHTVPQITEILMQ
jgi:protein required for attachment to host cells